MTRNTLTAIAEGLAATTKEFFQRKTAPLIERIDALEARIKALEDRPKYLGVWDAIKMYTPGNVVTWTARSLSMRSLEWRPRRRISGSYA
jgi:hypothetical protein